MIRGGGWALELSAEWRTVRQVGRSVGRAMKQADREYSMWCAISNGHFRRLAGGKCCFEIVTDISDAYGGLLVGNGA